MFTISGIVISSDILISMEKVDSMATIMVVDDYPVTQRVLTFQLYKTGHQVVTANNGREAIESLVTLPIDLLIVDLSMPEMDGISVLRHLRADSRFQTLPIIMLTGSGREQDRVLALSEGANVFLTKPTSTWELTDVVSYLLSDPVAAPYAH
jgi:CheY-like chemotaxis protein